MVWVFLGIIASIVVIIYKYQAYQNSWWRQFGDFVLDSAISLVVIAFCVFSLNIVGVAATDYRWQTTEQYAIRSINDTTQTRGSAFLGSGSIKDKPVYFYYKEIAPNTFVQEYVDVEDVKIIESDSPPRLRIEQEQSDNITWSFFTTNGTRYAFFVPKGSVVVNYSLDTAGR